MTRGEHLVAALALGAVGVWSGTIWQATTESHIDSYLKQKLVNAATEDSNQEPRTDRQAGGAAALEDDRCLGAARRP